MSTTLPEPRRIVWLPLLLILALLPACRREAREARPDPAAVAALDRVAAMPNGIGGTPPQVFFAMGQPFRDNAYQIAQGKRLFAWLGCEDCHAEGQGTPRGPALIDGWWNYGPDLVTIYLSIRDGRPGGMPAYGGRLPPDVLWQLAGYVQVLGSYVGSAAHPGRDDRPQTRPAENRLPAWTAPR